MELGTLTLFNLKFGTIYADPPWKYGNGATRNAAKKQYPEMELKDIINLPVKQLAADDAHLHLWTTNAFLFDAKTVMEAWGFTYKSCYVWVKPQMGLGNYWRVSHEFLLFGLRGNCKFERKNAVSWGSFSRSKHSAKPDEIRQLIETVSPSDKRLELFGRKLAPGWFVWGNEITEDEMKIQIDASQS